MTCLFNARAYRDGSAAAPHTGYWAVVGLLVREHLVPRVQGAGLPRRGPTCAGCADGHRSSQRHIEICNQYIFLCPAGPGAGPGAGPARFLVAPFGIQLAVALILLQRKTKPGIIAFLMQSLCKQDLDLAEQVPAIVPPYSAETSSPTRPKRMASVLGETGLSRLTC
jgi:hypothetical protein